MKYYLQEHYRILLTRNGDILCFCRLGYSRRIIFRTHSGYWLNNAFHLRLVILLIQVVFSCDAVEGFAIKRTA